jgi:aminopeptidase N
MLPKGYCKGLRVTNMMRRYSGCEEDIISGMSSDSG